MTWEKVKFDRKTLYEEVWSQPMTKLCKTYGLSNVGLAKICLRLNVPRPYLGYWERLRYGYKPKRPALPPLREGQPEEYVSERRSSPTLESQEQTEFDLAAARERLEENGVEVPPDLVDPHLLTQRVGKRLRHGRANQFGFLVTRKTGERLELYVSRASLDRALRVMDALVKALEQRSYATSPDPKGRHLNVTVLGEAVSIWIEELITTTERPLTPAKLKDKEKNPWKYSRPEYVHTPNGRLALKLNADVFEGIRRTWSDAEKHRVETSINSFIIGMVRAADRQKAQRLERERQAREWQAARERELEEQRRREKERQRVERLTKQLSDWEKSQKIREYIADIQAITRNPGKWNFEGIPLPEWMEWALRYADKIDPVGPIRRERTAESADKTGTPAAPEDHPSLE